MRDEIRSLVRLSEIDDSAFELEQEIEAVPAKVAELKADLDRLSAMLEAERAELADAEQLRDSQLEQIAQSTEGLSKAKAKGAKARNAREVDAAEREMEAVRRTIRDREEENKTLSAAIDDKGFSLLEREGKLEEFRKIFEEEDAQGKVRLEELQAERAKVTVGRDEVVKKLPRTIISRYERIRKKLGNGVVEVIDATCMGCRLHIPPQMFNNMHTPTEVEQCPHCLRLLFYRPALED